MSTQTAEPDVLVTLPSEYEEPVRPPRDRERLSGLRPLSVTPTYVGAVIVALGFIVLGVAWAQVARETDVALQMPLVLSGGFAAVCLVLVGLTIVSISAKRRDAVLREKQTALLADALAELRSVLEDKDDRP
jgi:hypothetical protein